jgi:hypothetical protein
MEEREFILERQKALQEGLTGLLSVPLISSSLLLRRFLDPANYTASFQGIVIILFFYISYILSFNIFIPILNIQHDHVLAQGGPEDGTDMHPTLLGCVQTPEVGILNKSRTLLLFG